MRKVRSRKLTYAFSFGSGVSLVDMTLLDRRREFLDYSVRRSRNVLALGGTDSDDVYHSVELRTSGCTTRRYHDLFSFYDLAELSNPSRISQRGDGQDVHFNIFMHDLYVVCEHHHCPHLHISVW